MACEKARELIRSTSQDVIRRQFDVVWLKCVDGQKCWFLPLSWLLVFRELIERERPVVIGEIVDLYHREESESILQLFHQLQVLRRVLYILSWRGCNSSHGC